MSFALKVIGCAWIPRVILSGIFLYASIVKIGALPEFYQDIQSYQLLSESWIMIVVFCLPALELVNAFFLLTGTFKKSAYLIFLVLMVVFLSAILSAYWRGLDIRCGCFGSSVRLSDYRGIFTRDILLIVVVIWGLRLELLGNKRQAGASTVQ